LRLDITRLKEAEVERQIALDRLDLAVSATADGVWEWDLKADTVWHSPRSRAMLGLAEPASDSAADQDTIESFLALVHTEDRERIEGALRAQIENQTPFDVEYRIDGVGKKLFWFHSHGQAVRDADGRPVRVVGINSDITERKQTEVELARYAAELTRANRELADMRSELENQALYDPLTKLPNRRLFMDRLERAVTLLDRTDLPYCVLLIDLDGFKAINDRYGHEAGDVVLRTVAERLSDASRQADTVARLGGDEFVALTQAGSTVAGSAVVAERWCAAVRVPISFDGGSLTVGCSIGVAHVAKAGVNGVEALRLADQAMYQAKAAGGGYAISGETTMDDNAQPTSGAATSGDTKTERPTSSADIG
jgi:diguanylate cyclase (GGDEF)-like protein/PAS domain S-box-containing protein